MHAKRALRAPRQRGPEPGRAGRPSAQRAQISRGVGVEVDAVGGDGHLEGTLEMESEQAARPPVAPEHAQHTQVGCPEEYGGTPAAAVK